MRWGCVGVCSQGSTDRGAGFRALQCWEDTGGSAPRTAGQRPVRSSLSFGMSVCKNAPLVSVLQQFVKRCPIPTCRGVSAASQRAIAAVVDSGSANSANSAQTTGQGYGAVSVFFGALHPGAHRFPTGRQSFCWASTLETKWCVPWPAYG